MKLSPLLPALAMALLFSCSRTSSELPSHISRSPRELSNPVVAVTGIDPDGWMATGSMQLAQPADSNALRVRAMVPLTNTPAFRTTLELRVDDEPIFWRDLGIGMFDISVPVPLGARRRRVTLLFSPTQALPNGDGRQVGARLESIGFETQNPIKAQPANEITSNPRVHLGDGWGTLETFGGETFRWVENDAQLSIKLGSAHDAVLTMTLEPGPGAAGRPLLLRVLDETGHQVGAVVLERRRLVRLALPLGGSGNDEFKLHVEGGGARVPNDSRVLNFRVFALHAGPWP